MKLYQKIAQACGAYRRCVENNNNYSENWINDLAEMERELPSGSGIDSGTKIDIDASGDEKVVLTMGFHHMDEMGGYAGWTQHTITVTPSFSGFHLKIGGRNRNQIKDYLHDVYSHALSEEIVKTVQPIAGVA